MTHSEIPLVGLYSGVCAKAIGRCARSPTGWMSAARPCPSTLRCLKSAGLVVVQVEGARRLYGIDPNGIEALKEWLDGFWDTTLAAFKRAAELEQKRRLEN